MPSNIRRRNRKGSKRPSWQVRTNDLAGRPINRSFSTETEAKNYLASIRLARRDGTLQRPSDKLVSEAVDDYLAAAQHKLRAKTVAAYRSNLDRTLVNRIGALRLVELTAPELQRSYNALLADGLAQASAVQVMYSVSAACRWWIKQSWLAANPMGGVEMSTGHRADVEVLSSAEVRTVLEAFDGHRLAPVVELLAVTGMRPSELVGLQWEDVDLERGLVKIRRSLTWANAGRYTVNDTKTRAGRRSVPVPPQTVEALKTWRRRQAEDRLRLGAAWPSLPFVFTDEFGEPLNQGAVTRRFHQVTEPVLGRRVKLYSLRHTCATTLLEAGLNPKVVAERLGHSSIVVTLNTYAHVTQTMQEAAVTALGAAFYG